MAKIPKPTPAKLGDNPTVTVTRMCERCGFRPVQGGKRSTVCKQCAGEAVSAACKSRNMRAPVSPRCACGNRAAPGSDSCATCQRMREEDKARLSQPIASKKKGITDAEQRRIDHAAYNSDISARAEHNLLIMARLMRGAVVQSLPVGHAEAGEPIQLEDIPDTPRSADVALGW